MKTILTISSLLLVAGLSAQQISFKESRKSFGFVHQGDTVHLSYAFTNCGDQPLLITDYQVECGCTIATFPKEPIQPGKGGVIEVKFDTHQKYDRHERNVIILSNSTSGQAELRFKGVVLKPSKKK